MRQEGPFVITVRIDTTVLLADHQACTTALMRAERLNLIVSNLFCIVAVQFQATQQFNTMAISQTVHEIHVRPIIHLIPIGTIGIVGVFMETSHVDSILRTLYDIGSTKQLHNILSGRNVCRSSIIVEDYIQQVCLRNLSPRGHTHQ